MANIPLDTRTITWTPPAVSPASFQGQVHAIAGCGTTDSLCEVQVSDPEPAKGVEVRVAATVSSNSVGGGHLHHSDWSRL
jgi:hypothetical protein